MKSRSIYSPVIIEYVTFTFVETIWPVTGLYRHQGIVSKLRMDEV